MTNALRPVISYQTAREVLEHLATFDVGATIALISAWGANEAGINCNNAAWEFIDSIDSHPLLVRCPCCRWPVLDGELHEYCNSDECAQCGPDPREEAEGRACEDCGSEPPTELCGWGDCLGDDNWLEHERRRDHDDEPDEDPLEGDVEPTGGYPEPEIHPQDAHRDRVMRQHGDYTGGW